MRNFLKQHFVTVAAVLAIGSALAAPAAAPRATGSTSPTTQAPQKPVIKPNIKPEIGIAVTPFRAMPAIIIAPAAPIEEPASAPKKKKQR